MRQVAKVLEYIRAAECQLCGVHLSADQEAVLLARLDRLRVAILACRVVRTVDSP